MVAGGTADGSVGVKTISYEENSTLTDGRASLYFHKGGWHTASSTISFVGCSCSWRLRPTLPPPPRKPKTHAGNGRICRRHRHTHASATTGNAAPRDTPPLHPQSNLPASPGHLPPLGGCVACAPAADYSENYLPNNSSSATSMLGNVLGSGDPYEFGAPSLAARHFLWAWSKWAVHSTADRVTAAADHLVSDGVNSLLFSNHGSGTGLPKRMRSLTSGLPTMPPRDRYVWTLVIGNFAHCDDTVSASG